MYVSGLAVQCLHLPCALCQAECSLALREGTSLSMQLARNAHPCFYTIQTHTRFTGVHGALMRCKRCFTFPPQTPTTIQRCALLFTEFNARFAITALVWLVPLCLVITFFVVHDSHLSHNCCGVKSFSMVFHSMCSRRRTLSKSSKPGF